MDCNFTTNKIIFDYFSFTIKTDGDDITPEDVISMLGLDGVSFIETYGSKGFRNRYYYDGVSRPCRIWQMPPTRRSASLRASVKSRYRPYGILLPSI